MNIRNVDGWRKTHLAIAEWMDAWRMVPRLLVGAYAYMMWQVVKWYMAAEPHIIPGCDIKKLGEACIVAAPSTQHAALVTAVIGVAAAVFGLYANTGRKWEGSTFIPWGNDPEEQNLTSEPIVMPGMPSGDGDETPPASYLSKTVN